MVLIAKKEDGTVPNEDTVEELRKKFPLSVITKFYDCAAIFISCMLPGNIPSIPGISLEVDAGNHH